MALVFGDSFDHYLVADILKKWTSGSPPEYPDIASAYALPPHAMGLLMAGNSNKYYQKTLPAALATFVCGVWFRTGNISSDSTIVSFHDASGDEHVSIRYVSATSKMTFTRNGTVLATSTNTISTNTWYHIEAKVTIHNSAGAYEVRVEGSSTNWIPAASSADTQNGGNASIASVRIWTRGGNDGTSSNHRFQDFYVLNTTGAPDDFIGPARFAVLRPVAVGNSAQWAGNYADNWTNVAELQGDSDTTFNQDSTAGHIDLFAMTDIPAGTVHAIQHVLMARKDAGDARTIRPKTRIGSTNYDGSTVTLGATYAFYTEPASVSPATTDPWDDAEVNAAEFGYELVS